MAIIFPTSNLPSASWPWARQVEKSITTLDAFTSQNEINNTARDNQLASSLLRVSKAASDAATAAAQAQAAIDGLGNLDQTTSTYKINAANVTVGTLTGITLVGNTIKTAATGTRVELAGTRADFYYGTSNVGYISGGTGGASDDAIVISANVANRLFSVGPSWMGFYGNVSNFLGISGNQVQLGGSNGVSISGALKDALSITSVGSISGTSISGSSLSSSGSLTVSGQTNMNGLVYASGMTATSSTSGIPVWRSTSTNQLYAYTSSRKQKTDIQPLDIDYDKFTSMPVRSFIYNADFEEFGPTAQRTYGYIAEELDELEYDNLVVFKNNDETGEKEPYSVSFFSLAAATHHVTNIQAQKIRDLEARVAALEAK